MRIWIRNCLGAGLVGLALCLSAPAWAFDARTVTIKVGFGPGGNFDFAARAVARHIGRFLPGNPDVIVQNVAGGGSMRLVQLMLGSEPADGSVLGLVTPALGIAPTLDPANADYDPLALRWIGALERGADTLCIVAKEAGIDSVEKFAESDFTIGALGRGGTTYMFPAAAKSVLGAKFRIVTGFTNSEDVELAMQRGEITGHCIAQPERLERDHLREQVNVVIRFAGAQESEFAAVPRVYDLVDDPIVKQAVAFIESGRYQGPPLIAPAGTPDETVAILREAFNAMTADPDFIEDSARIAEFILDPIPGADLEAMLTDMLAADPAVFEVARELVQ